MTPYEERALLIIRAYRASISDARTRRAWPDRQIVGHVTQYTAEGSFQGLALTEEDVEFGKMLGLDPSSPAIARQPLPVPQATAP